MDNDTAALVATPAAKWLADGQPDPHGNKYDCERAKLPKGALTDDELANALFMADRTDLDLIVWQTAAKERIRWLSRAFTAQAAEIARLTGELAEIAEVLDCGQGDDDGPQIMPDFEDGDSLAAKVDTCLHLLETRRDVIAGYAASEVTLQAAIAAALARVAVLGDVLTWYGEQSRLARLIHSEGDAGRHAIAADGGAKARDALKAGEA